MYFFMANILLQQLKFSLVLNVPDFFATGFCLKMVVSKIQIRNNVSKKGNKYQKLYFW